MASGKKSRSERSRYWKCCMSAGVVALLGVVVASLGSGKLFGAQKAPFHIEEATISDIQSALLAKRITTVGVVNLYLTRIKAYNGTCVEMPEGLLGPMKTIPPRDASHIKRLREAGAIILAKANAGTPQPRNGFGGVVCNPYDTERTPGVSSAGSGASVSANLVTCSIAEETGTSIRIPARSTNVDGLAPTQELV